MPTVVASTSTTAPANNILQMRAMSFGIRLDVLTGWVSFRFKFFGRLSARLIAESNAREL